MTLSRRKFMVSCGAVALGAPMVSASAFASATRPTPIRMPEPSEVPFVKLFTLCGPGALPDTSGASLRKIARNYHWINSHGGRWLCGQGDAETWEYPFGPSAGVDERGRSVGQRLRELNPELILSNYRNGSYTSQHAMKEAERVERQLPHAIAVHDTGYKLVRPLPIDASVLELTPREPLPVEAPPGYPFKASTTENLHSIDKTRYVGWLRLNDEILRIDEVEPMRGGGVRLVVRRGYWMTEASSHGIDLRVFQPVYCGNRRSDGTEYYLSGLPDGESSQRALRYIMMQQQGAFWDFLASQVQECLEEGYNGPWLDCTTSEWINHSNAFGDEVQPFDLDRGRVLDPDTFREYHQRKIHYLFQRFPEAEIFVNWVFPQYYFENGTDRHLFTGAGGYQPVSGGAIEIYGVPGRMDWHQLMRMQFDMRDQGFRAVSWAKWGALSGQADVPASQYFLYAYCSHLLVHEANKPLYFGVEWAESEELSTPFDVPSFVYWDLGSPEDRFTTLSEAELPPPSGVYARRFSRGQVLVNPATDRHRQVELDGEFFDITSGRWVRSVEMPPISGCLLLATATD